MDDELYPGNVVVTDDGIYQVINVDCDGIVSMRTIMNRKTFVEAYNKYIKGGEINNGK